MRKRSARRWRRTTLLGEAQPAVGERDGPAAELDEALALHPLDHLGDGRTRDLEALGDAGLDDVDVVLAELEDGFAVLLEGGVPLGRDVLGHAESVRPGLTVTPRP